MNVNSWGRKRMCNSMLDLCVSS